MQEQKKLINELKNLLQEKKIIESLVSEKKIELRSNMEELEIDSLKGDGLIAYITTTNRWILKDKDQAKDLGLMEEKQYETFTVRLNNKEN